MVSTSGSSLTSPLPSSSANLSMRKGWRPSPSSSACSSLSAQSCSSITSVTSTSTRWKVGVERTAWSEETLPTGTQLASEQRARVWRVASSTIGSNTPTRVCVFSSRSKMLSQLPLVSQYRSLKGSAGGSKGGPAGGPMGEGGPVGGPKGGRGPVGGTMGNGGPVAGTMGEGGPVGGPMGEGGPVGGPKAETGPFGGVMGYRGPVGGPNE